MKTCSDALKVKDDVDEYQAVGISVAAKLQKMNDRQKIIAELLVNKILTKGLLNQLTESMDITENYYIPPNVQPYPYPYEHPHSQSTHTTQDPVILNNKTTQELESHDYFTSL